jgi:Ca-activated chloride channel family protein
MNAQPRHVRTTPVRARRVRRLVVAGTVVALAATAGVTLSRSGSTDASCPRGAAALTLEVSPDIAPAVADVVRRDPSRSADARCSPVTVAARDSADVADTIRTAKQGRPDVWIPDSSIWVQRSATDGRSLPPRHPSIARSPVVLAMSTALANELGRAQGHLNVGRVIDKSQTAHPVRLLLPDPRRSAATVGEVLAVEAAVSGRANAREIQAAALGGPSGGTFPDPSQLLARASRDANTTAAVSEQAVWSHNTAPAQVVAVYPRTGGMVLDYPYVVLNSGAATRAAAARVLAALHGDQGRDRLLAAGFRDGNGKPGGTLTAEHGVDPGASPAAHVPPLTAVDDAVRTLEALHESTRILAVVDVSGSMGRTVPGTGGATRLDLARQAAAAGLALYPDDTQVGLWVFSTHLTPTTDYRQMVPIEALAGVPGHVSGRERLSQALAGTH